jgi:urease accessory protein
MAPAFACGMKSTQRWFCFAVPAFLVAAAVAHAHPGHDGHELTWDFQAGFVHPFTGWDHALAMLAVGWWAVQLGDRARWLIPSVFMVLLAAGAAAGRMMIPPAAVEQAVAASVVVFGLLVAVSARLPLTLGAGLVAGFAVFHGLAHGAGMPATAAFVGYATGFLAASAVLLLGGAVLGSVASRAGAFPSRAAGALLAVAGLVVLAA